MIGNMTELRTEPKLLATIARLRDHKMTAKEVLEQKASFVYGSISHGPGTTKEQVRKRVMERAGMEIDGDSL